MSKALLEKNIPFDCIDITKDSYNLLLGKMEAAIACEKEFAEEGNLEWYNMLIEQTDYANKLFEDFAKEMARYVYVVRK